MVGRRERVNPVGARRLPRVWRRADAAVVDVYDRDGAYDPYDEAPAEGVAAADDDAGPRRRTARRLPVAARVASTLGELLITCGVIIALFLVYELWWTDVVAREVARHDIAQLKQEWARHPNGAPGATGGAPGNATVSPTIGNGQGFALLYVPRLGQDWYVEVMQGISVQDVLDKGAAGHYPNTAMPWDSSGNFALAGHRDTGGAIFHDLNELHTGDLVYVETASTWYVYRMDAELRQTNSDNVGVIDPIPANYGAPVYPGPGRYITLTTCTPVFTSNYRLIWWGHMISQQPKSAGVPKTLASTLPPGTDTG